MITQFTKQNYTVVDEHNNHTNNTPNVNVVKAVTNGHADVKKNDFFKKSNPVKEPSGSKDTNEGKASGGKKEKSKPPVTNGRIASFFTKGNVKKEPVVDKEHVVAPKIDSQLPENDASSEKPALKIESPDTNTGTKKKSVNTEDVKKMKTPARKTENVSHISVSLAVSIVERESYF